MTTQTGVDVVEEIERALAELDRRATELKRARRTILQMRGQIPWELTSMYTDPKPEPAAKPRSLGEPGLTLPEAAVLVLEQAAAPLNVQQLAEGLILGGYPYPRGIDELRVSLRGTIARNVREGGMLANFGRGVYGLRQWRSVIEDSSELERTSALRGLPPC
jgi:hypothetical protein